jgi:tetratricopeptide (TPR) repeat protein
VVLFHRWGNRHNLIRLLVRDPSWSLVYYDEVGVVYVRTRGNEERIQEAAASFPEWRERTEARLTAPIRAWQRPVEREVALESYAAVLSTIGALDEAIVNFRRLLDLGPRPEREAHIRFRLGLLLARSGDRNQALLELRRAEELDPDDKRVAQAIADLGD